MDAITREQYFAQHMPPGGDPSVEYPRLYEAWRVFRIVQREEAARALRAPMRLARAQMKEAERARRLRAKDEARHIREAARACARPEREVIAAQQDGRCAWCKTPLTGVWYLNHHIPLSRGGTARRDNKRAVCASCHQLKGVLLPEQFAKMLGLDLI